MNDQQQNEKTDKPTLAEIAAAEEREARWGEETPWGPLTGYPKRKEAPISDTPTYDDLSALCAQMAAALEALVPADMMEHAGDFMPDWHNAYAALTAYRTLSPDPQWQRVPELLEALRPFAAMADHYPMKGMRYGNRPQSGTLYAVSSGDLPDAEITVEHLHAAKRARGEG